MPSSDCLEKPNTSLLPIQKSHEPAPSKSVRRGIAICASLVFLVALAHFAVVETVVLRHNAVTVITAGNATITTGPSINKARTDWMFMRPSAAELPSLPVTLWDISMPPPRWATSENWTTFPPLGMEELERSFEAPLTLDAWCPWVRSASMLESGKHVDIAVIGGSVTKGAKCGVACSWVGHLSGWLARARPHWNVTVTNLGESGIGSHEWVYRDDPFLAHRRPDIIVVDTSVSRYCFYAGHASARCVNPVSPISSLEVLNAACNWIYFYLAGQHFSPHGTCPAR